VRAREERKPQKRAETVQLALWSVKGKRGHANTCRVKGARMCTAHGGSLTPHVLPLLPLAVSCASFDFTTEDPTTTAYWGERWELYKHQYVLSRFTWIRGIRKIEFWNEPDLTGTLSTLCLLLLASIVRT
jgi:hypothetical protein